MRKDWVQENSFLKLHTNRCYYICIRNIFQVTKKKVIQSLVHFTRFLPISIELMHAPLILTDKFQIFIHFKYSYISNMRTNRISTSQLVRPSMCGYIMSVYINNLLHLSIAPIYDQLELFSVFSQINRNTWLVITWDKTGKLKA